MMKRQLVVWQKPRRSVVSVKLTCTHRCDFSKISYFIMGKCIVEHCTNRSEQVGEENRKVSFFK